jgi:hypothetical protein
MMAMLRISILYLFNAEDAEDAQRTQRPATSA